MTRRRRPKRDKSFYYSVAWKTLRDVKLAVNPVCEKCSSADHLQIHHLTYDRFGGSELMSDLQTLCSKCHSSHHMSEKIERRKRSRPDIGLKYARRAAWRRDRLQP